MSVAAAWLIGLVAAAGTLGALGLGRASLWVDEVHSFEFAALPSPALVVLNAAARDAYPPLYFLALHAWMWLGAPEVWLRGLSLLCHLATIPAIFLAARRLSDAPTALVAAGLLAFNPFHLAFAREARMYAPQALLAVIAMNAMAAWALAGSARGRRTVRWAGIALLYTHFISALLLFAQWLAARFAHARRGWLPGTGRWVLWSAVAFLPWSPFFLKAFVTAHGFGAEADAGSLAYWFTSALGAGFAKPEPLLAAGAVVVTAGGLLGFLALPPGPRRRLLLLWAFVPPGLELISTALGKPVFGERTLIVSTPAWLLLIAAGIAGAAGVARWGLAAAVAVVTVASHVHEIRDNLPLAPAHREALTRIAEDARPGDVIVHTATVTYHAAHEYYLPRLAAVGRAVPPDHLIDVAPAPFRGGRLAGMFREGWRRIRARLDPGGAIRSGADPARITESDLLRIAPRRIVVLRTDAGGARRLWRLIPSVYYPAPAAKVFTRSLDDHPAVAGRYRLDGVVDRRPGLVVERWLRR